MLTKTMLLDQFRAAGPKIHEVETPGGKVFLRELSAHQRSAYEKAITDKGSLDSCRERLFVLSVCDEAGSKLFDEKDLKTIGDLDGSLVEPVFRKALEINGLVAKPAEEIRKNSEPTPSAG